MHTLHQLEGCQKGSSRLCPSHRLLSLGIVRFAMVSSQVSLNERFGWIGRYSCLSHSVSM